MVTPVMGASGEPVKAKQVARPRRRRSRRSLLGSLRKAVSGIRVLGWRRSMQVVRFTVQKVQMDFRHRAKRGAGPVTPGHLVRGSAIEGGARLEFEGGVALVVVFMAEDVVRLTWYPGDDPLPYGVLTPAWPLPEVDVAGGVDGWTVATAALVVEVGPDGSVRYGRPGSVPFRVDEPPARHGCRWQHRARLRPSESVHGLGERAAPLDLRGDARKPCTYEFWNMGPGGKYGPGSDPLYLGVPVYLTVHPDEGYLVFHENTHRGRLTVDGKVEVTFEGGALRTWVVPGSPAHVLDRYTELTGRPALPPKWAFGLHHARWGFKTAQEVRDAAAGYRKCRLPLAAVHLDIDYMDDYRVFTMSPDRFGDLTGLAADLSADGTRLVLIINPGVQRSGSFDLYVEGVRHGRFCQLPAGEVADGVVWPGWVAFPDFTDHDTRRWWGAQYRKLLDIGAAGVWHDMNEPVSFSLVGGSTPPKVMRHACEGRGGDHVEVRNVYALQMARAAHDALADMAPGRRPFIVSRAGWAGIQRYAWTWTGDTESSWDMLQQTVPQILGLGLSGIPFAGPDIGGFRGKPTAELYLRWFGLATFLPFLRAHSAFDSTPRAPWEVAPDNLDDVRRLIDLRCSLVPYLYSLAWEAHQRGTPLVRPLWWTDQADRSLHDIDDEFLVGDALLVAPVLEESARHRTVRLPDGWWYPFGGGVPVEGGDQVTVDAPLGTVPAFVRAGAVLPLEDPDGSAHLRAFVPPAGGGGGGSLYLDAGDGDGPCRWEQYAVELDGRRLRIESEVQGTSKVPGPDSLRIVGATVRSASVDGDAVLVAGDTLPLRRWSVLEIDLD